MDEVLKALQKHLELAQVQYRLVCVEAGKSYVSY
jgi:hypothetical protein